MRLREALKREGFRQFFKKYIALLVVIVLYAPVYNYMAYFFSLRNGIGIKNVCAEVPPSLLILVAFGTLVPIIFLLIFFTISREKLYRIKNHKINLAQNLLFLFLTLLVQIPILLLIKKGVDNLTYDAGRQCQIINQLIPISLALGFLMIFYLLFSLLIFFDFDCLRKIYKKFRKEILVAFLFVVIGSIVAVLLYFFIWEYLALFIAKVLFVLYKLSYSDAVLFINGNIPALTVNGITIYITKACTGIEGMAFFAVFFAATLLMDWNKVNKKKALYVGILGIIIAQAINILRIYSLIIVAIEYDGKFAFSVFHPNIGWILFIPFFIIFYELTFNYVRGIKPKQKKK